MKRMREKGMTICLAHIPISQGYMIVYVQYRTKEGRLVVKVSRFFVLSLLSFSLMASQFLGAALTHLDDGGYTSVHYGAESCAPLFSLFFFLPNRAYPPYGTTWEEQKQKVVTLMSKADQGKARQGEARRGEERDWGGGSFPSVSVRPLVSALFAVIGFLGKLETGLMRD
ncbi:hypothetical protein QBC44DRAFT_318622 [Cladorrhinum sp. PSN332]|nr:hypothetical protein QBC44DRAFT_318622 [Cladorrhinum sp. PSN332]